MSDYKPLETVEKELFAVVETIENGEICSTAVPEIWIKGHYLYWPPGFANRRNPVPPESDWVPHMCRILKGSIGNQ